MVVSWTPLPFSRSSFLVVVSFFFFYFFSKGVGCCCSVPTLTPSLTPGRGIESQEGR